MDQNEKTIRHVFDEIFKKANFTGYEQLISENVIVHCPESWQKIHACLITNRSDVKKVDLEYAKAFQMIDVEIGEILTNSQKIFVRWNAKGVHVDDFFNLPSTKLRFNLSGQGLYQFNKEGQINEVWQSWDMLGLLEQISTLPMQKLVNLSEREKDCLRYLIEGKTAKETACLLNLSHRTIEYYFENLKDKLNCVTKRELIKIARLFEKNNIFK